MSKKYYIKGGKSVEVSDEIHEYLTTSDRQMRYCDEDRKQSDWDIDMEKEKATEIPSREDSFERLTDIGKEFADITSDFQEQAIKKVMLDQALKKLSEEEYYLITQLFYLQRTERDMADELGLFRNAVHSQKQRILRKLKKLLNVDKLL